MTVGAILLAAGSARRMGSDKLLADLGGTPLALHALEAIRKAGLAGPIVAVAPGAPAYALFAGRATIVEVADHAAGMGHSIAAAIAAVPPDWTAAIVALADMPLVRAATFRALAAATAPDAIVRAGHAGRPGNPVLWGRDHFGRLATLAGDEGGRRLFAELGARLLDVDDPGVTFDVDTPETLADARARLSAGTDAGRPPEL